MDRPKTGINHAVIDFSKEKFLSTLNQLEECRRENDRLILQLKRYEQESESARKEILELKAKLSGCQKIEDHPESNIYKVVLCEGILPSDVAESARLETDIRKFTFTVDKSANITGIGIFGVRSDPFNFNVLTKLVEIDCEETKLLICQNDRVICDGTPTIHHVKFHQPVPIVPKRNYGLTILVNNMKTHYGAKFRNVLSVPIDEKENITFLIDSQKASYGKEQIQSIYFTL